LTTATPITEAFDAHLRAMPDWAPEFEVHRPWVEALMQDAWRAATERAAKLCDEQADFHQLTHNTQAEQAAEGCAASIRGKT
jgi:hypothetical protein